MAGYNLRTIVFCPRCFYDVEEDFGYLEWKSWKFCPECGSELIRVPVENRPDEYKIFKELGLDIALEKQIAMLSSVKEISHEAKEKEDGYITKRALFDKLKRIKEDNDEINISD